MELALCRLFHDGNMKPIRYQVVGIVSLEHFLSHQPREEVGAKLPSDLAPTEVRRYIDVQIIAILTLTTVVAAGLNARLIFDDLFFTEYFRALWIYRPRRAFIDLYFILYLQGAEYRLYGLSKVIHLVLFWMIDTRAWAWGMLIGGAQAASGWGIFLLMQRFGVERSQSWAAVTVWILSPFAITFCFHHFTYLLLPYCATLLTLLYIRSRSLAALGGFAIASTGESHLIASGALILFVSLSLPDERSVRDRIFDTVVPIAVAITTIVLHRLLWSVLIPDQATTGRFVYRTVDPATALERARLYFESVPRGMWHQVSDTLALAGSWSIACAAVAGAVFMRAIWTQGSADRRASNLVPVVLLGLFVVSLGVLLLVGIVAGQVSFAQPRRYGYAPYTFLCMAVVAFLFSPMVREKIGVGLGSATVSMIVGLWLTLEAVCFPVVRAQDEEVWARVGQMKAERGGAFSVVFETAWTPTDKPDYKLGIWTDGIRGQDFPELFESAFGVYWWQGHHALVVEGAQFAADRYERLDDKNVRLFGNGLGRPLAVCGKTLAMSAIC
jgi:hypothetical protein